MSNLINWITVDDPKGSSYIKSSFRLQGKNATLNSTNIDIDIFSMLLH